MFAVSIMVPPASAKRSRRAKESFSPTVVPKGIVPSAMFIGNLRGDPRLPAREESDPCGAGQGQAIRRQADRRRNAARHRAVR
ncbi:hypothetical protein GCM10012289_16530 [Nonomuraea cavernae]|uniref:Uncharacterized protein n=1 Tax=Nonomuraea cavernae TaxID=2045107 RepID=A0A917YRY7_9ACTN|nr:hypothetical protein GCM10012289_16530 [Nonomuraea cavernae]